MTVERDCAALPRERHGLLPQLDVRGVAVDDHVDDHGLRLVGRVAVPGERVVHAAHLALGVPDLEPAVVRVGHLVGEAQRRVVADLPLHMDESTAFRAVQCESPHTE